MIPWKPKLVRFADGRYGVRRWIPLFGHEFRDLKDNFWWSMPTHVEAYAMGDEAEARKALADSGKPRFDKGVPA